VCREDIDRLAALAFEDAAGEKGELRFIDLDRRV
jgi:hypothetical protein